MATLHPQTASESLVLPARTAADLMTPNLLSLRDDATVREALSFLADKGISAAPVIDDAGRPIGVLSRADLIVHERENRAAGSPAGGEPMQIRDIMTPVVFSVTPGTAARKVVEDMVGLKVHRLFVIGDDGILIGVISALDVLRHLLPSSGSVE